MIEKRLEAPVVVREVGDSELIYFQSCVDLFSDRFDILWGEEYEGWDAQGSYFRVERRYPVENWWRRLLRVDGSHLELVSVEQSSIDIQRLLEQELGVVYSSASEPTLSIPQLIRLGLNRQEPSNESCGDEHLVWF